MDYQVLARKWRPRIFGDVIGQAHIVRSLQNIVKNNKIGQAYLFTGTRGVGKTSVARIFSKALRCLELQESGDPCLKCSSCLAIAEEKGFDVIEIDGASHNGVDHIRQLISNIQYLPTSGRYKIYIIDEVHMLSKEAFNALLKTLEEPPEHVVFIFATTLPDKLLDTVLSRCQRFDFKSVGPDDLFKHLAHLANKENICFESDWVIKQIILEAKGSVRDALSLFDQVLNYWIEGPITEELLVNALGLARTSSVWKIVKSIFYSDPVICSRTFRELLNDNIEVSKISVGILDIFYEIIQLLELPEKMNNHKYIDDIGWTNCNSKAEIFWIYETLVKDFKWGLDSLDPQKVIEIILQKICYRKDFFLTQKHDEIESERPTKVSEEETTKEQPVHSHESENQIEEKMTTHQEDEDEDQEINKGNLELQELELSDVEEDENDELISEIKVEETKENKEVSPEIPPVVSVPTPMADIKGPKTWDQFLDCLYKKSPALAANLTQGNLLQELNFSKKPLVISLGFLESGKIFLDYLQRVEVFSRLLMYLGPFFAISENEISLEMKLVDEKQRIEEEFYTRAEIEEQKRDELMASRKKELLNHKYIQAAEKIFNSKVDKVIINNFEH